MKGTRALPPGNQKLFTDYFQQCENKLFDIACNIVRQENLSPSYFPGEFITSAHELLHDACIAAMYTIHPFDSVDEFQSWFSGIILHLACKKYQKLNRDRQRILYYEHCISVQQEEEMNYLDYIYETHPAFDPITQRETLLLVEQTMAHFSARDREIVQLSIVEDKTPQEVAFIMHCSVSNVYLWKCRVLLRLRELCEK